MDAATFITTTQVAKHLDVSIFHLDYLCDLDDQTPVLAPVTRRRIEGIREELSWALKGLEDGHDDDHDADTD
jgi:hypothetical protein